MKKKAIASVFGIFALFIFLNMNFVSSYEWNETLNDGLNLYFDFNSTIDLINGVYNLSYNEGTVDFNMSNCKIGNCAQMFSNKNLVLVANDSVNITKEMSFNFWVRMTNAKVSLSVMVSEVQSTAFLGVGDNLAQSLYTNGLFIGGVYTSNKLWQNDVWYMVTYTKNSSGYGKIYINGTLEAQGQSTWGNNGNTWNIGVSHLNTSEMAGQIDEMSWYGRELSQSEILQHYNNENGITYQSNTTDSSPPSVTINTPLNQTYSTTSMIFNITSTDETLVDTCLYSLDSGVTNITMLNTTTLSNYNATNSSMTEGSHKANFYCNDSLGYLNNSESVSFDIDKTFIKNFNNSLTSENITFSGNQNFTRYLTIPRYSNITSAYLSLSGYETSTTTIISSLIKDALVNLLNTPLPQYGDTNYGDCIIMITSNDSELTYFNSYRSYLSFDISSIANASSINYAELGLYNYQAPDSYGYLGVYHLYDDWKNGTGANILSEYDLTWNNQPCGKEKEITNNTNCNLTYSGLILVTPYIDYDGGGITSILREDIGKLSTSMVLVDLSNNLNRWHSKEYYNPPLLYINYNLFPLNPYISINNTQVWNYTGEFNITNNETSDFASTLNIALNNGACDCLNCTLQGNNCTIPITFHSDTAGILEYSSININYEPVPYVYLISPENNTYSSSTKNFTCNATDENNLANVTLYIWNSTGLYNNSEFRTLTGNYNSTTFNTINFSHSGTYYWNCLAYNSNSYSNWHSSNYTLNVDTSNPIITLNYPSNNTYVNSANNIDFNCTVEGKSLDSLFLYGDFNGTYLLNKTELGITSAVMNNFKLNLTEGNYSWTCGANKTTTSTVTFSQYGNYSLAIDTTNPDVEITTANQTSVSGLAITINFNITDLNMNNCYFTLRDSSGNAHNYAENTSVTCSDTSRSISALAYGTYTFQLWGDDKAGNLNSSIISFTTTSPPSPSGGGGGGTPEKVSAVAIMQIKNRTFFEDYQRAVLYSRIREFCLNKIGCSLNSDKKLELKYKLEEQDVEIGLDELQSWIDAYNNQELESVSILESLVQRFSLFTGVLEIIESVFRVNPSKIDAPWIVFSNTFEYTIASNKVLRDARVVKPEFGWSLNLTSDTIAVLQFKIPKYPPSWGTKTFTNTINYIDLQNNSIFQPVTIRAINLQGNLSEKIPIPLYILIILSIILFFAVFYTLRRKGIKFKKILKWTKKG